eukprot:450908_1
MQYNEIGLYDENRAIYISGPGLFKVNYHYPPLDTQIASSEVAYICNTQFTGGKQNDVYFFELWFHGIVVDNCEFIHIENKYALRTVNPVNSSNSIIKDSLFDYVRYGVSYTGSMGSYPEAKELSIHHNAFLHITDMGIRASDKMMSVHIVDNLFENDIDAVNYAHAIYAYSP